MKKYLVLIDLSVELETLPKKHKNMWYVLVNNFPEKIKFIEIPKRKEWWEVFAKL